jgi:hypothetical protein
MDLGDKRYGRRRDERERRKKKVCGEEKKV